MSNFLVSGGAGFVGSHLTEQLVKNDNRVVILDDLSNGFEKNIAHLKNIIFVKNSVTDIPNEITNLKYDGIFHLATHPRSFSLSDPKRDIEVNCKGMINMLELAKKNNCKLVFTSNSGIAGSMDQYAPIDENYPNRPTTPYDANKLVCEYYAKIYHNVFNVKCALVRFATVYGYRQVVNEELNWRPVVATFLHRMKNNDDVFINGTGEQTRDLLYVKDAVDGVIKAMHSDVVDANMAILSSNTETSINEIFNILKRKTGYDKKPIHNEELKGDLKSMKLSYDKATKIYDYKPKYTPDQGIAEMLDFYE